MAGKPTYEELERRVKELEREVSRFRKEEEKFRSLAENTSDWVWEVDLNGSYTYSNPKVKDLLGYDLEDILGKTPFDFMPPEEANRVSGLFKKTIESGEPFSDLENTGICKDGREVILETSGVPIFDEAGRISGYRGIDRDITQRKQTEEKLRESEERYRLLIENIPSVTWITSEHGQTTFISPNVEKIYGYSQKEIYDGGAGSWFGRVHPDDVNRVRESLEKMFTDNQALDVEYRLRTKEDKWIWVHDKGITAFEKDGLRYAYGIFSDITERKRAEEDLKKSEEKYRHLFNSGNDAVTIHNFREAGEYGPFVDVNDVACTKYGYSREEFLRLKPGDIVDEPDEKRREEIRKTILRDRHMIFEMTQKHRDGSAWPGEMNASVIELDGKLVVLTINRDISKRRQAEREREKLQTQLHQAMRMEAVGTLAGGVAHDFNNLLMGIQGRISLMLHRAEPSHPHYEHLKKIEDYVETSADLTKQLLGFARGGKYELRPIDLNDLLKKNSRMFARTKKEINIHSIYQENIWTVQADSTQIEQVLMNLFVNASQAMPGGGDLYLETENVKLDGDYIKPFSVTPGTYVKISFTDTGIGMDKNTQSRVFEPFFTTRAMGRGTGLGLASAYGIIKNHGGIINVYSEKGKGTTFNIYLSTSDEPPGHEEKGSHEILRGTETILLVDDEDITIEVGQELLKVLGYRVLTAGSGKAALDVYKKHAHEIQLVILDMIMPGMGGGETFDRLNKIDPDIKVLLSSGYSITGDAQEILDRGCNGFLQKPFNMSSMSQKLRTILDEK